MSSEDEGKLGKEQWTSIAKVAVPVLLAAIVTMFGTMFGIMLENRANQRQHVRQFVKFEEEIFGIMRDLYSSGAEENRARMRILTVWCDEREANVDMGNCGIGEKNSLEFHRHRAEFWDKKEQDLVEIWKGRAERL